MDNVLICGSSLARQVVEHCHNSGTKINNILFKGKIDLNLIESSLKKTNVKFKTIVFVAGNDLLPTKLHRIGNKTHICLANFCEEECWLAYNGLINVFSRYAECVIMVEPPPRAQAGQNNRHTLCSFYGPTVAQRFRQIVNTLDRKLSIGVFSNFTLSGFLGETNSRISSPDNTHFSKEALKIIQNQVIAKYI